MINTKQLNIKQEKFKKIKVDENANISAILEMRKTNTVEIYDLYAMKSKNKIKHIAVASICDIKTSNLCQKIMDSKRIAPAK